MRALRRVGTRRPGLGTRILTGEGSSASNNGIEDISWINEGKGYPRLWWELIPEN
jgi:hypothetical protein